MDYLKNEERRIIPPETLFLLLGEVWSQFSSLSCLRLWLSEGDAKPFPYVIFLKNSVILQCLDPFAVSALLLL